MHTLARFSEGYYWVVSNLYILKHGGKNENCNFSCDCCLNVWHMRIHQVFYVYSVGYEITEESEGTLASLALQTR